MSRGLIYSALLGLIIFTSCSGAQKASQLNLDEPNEELERTTTNLDQFVVQLVDAIEQMNGSSDRLMELDTAPLRSPFPIDVFKHALISCLNVVDTSGEGPPDLVAVAKRFDVTCPVPAIVSLDRKLEPGTSDEAYARAALKNLDTVRVNRSVAQALLRGLPDQLAHTSAFIGVRKSELRKTRQQVRRRKAEYRMVDYRATLTTLDDYEIALTALEDRVFEIDAKRSGWDRALGDKIDTLYKALTTLGQQTEAQRTKVEF